MVPFEELRPGVIVTYRLGGIGVETNYDEVWRGRVIYVNPVARLVCVKLLEVGYEDMEDSVWWEHVISVTRED